MKVLKLFSTTIVLGTCLDERRNIRRASIQPLASRRRRRGYGKCDFFESESAEAPRFRVLLVTHSVNLDAMISRTSPLCATMPAIAMSLLHSKTKVADIIAKQ